MLFRSILKQYDLEEHHKKILTLACKAWDRAEDARKIIDEKGATFQDRFQQPKERPEVKIERQSRNDFRLFIRELGLDVEVREGQDHNLPRIKGKR